MILSFVFASVIVFSVAYLCGTALASGSEQEVYNAYTAQDSTMTIGQYEEAISVQVEQEPWVAKYFCDTTPCDCSSCVSTKRSWLLFGIVLIAAIVGLHFYLA